MASAASCSLGVGTWIRIPNGRRTADLEAGNKYRYSLEHREGVNNPERAEGQVEAQDAEPIC
ncbi:hypothetical protein GCM10009839_13430 [Catenulispora yoronensis]|uniref:Uncharacterized protein n=1 Tax=Catenulispora yoronensis TaxID=450799 RepID=A0ABN2TSG5_9ACTN